MLTGIRVLHTFVFVIVFTAILFLLYCGVTNHLSRLTVFAFALVLIEVLIYVGHRFRCPLRTLAEKLTPKGKPVVDIYLPPWLAAQGVTISTYLLAIACLLLLVRVFQLAHR